MLLLAVSENSLKIGFFVVSSGSSVVVVIVFLIVDLCPSGYEVVSHCGFDLQFHNDLMILNTFHIFLGCLVFSFKIFLLKSFFCPFLNCVAFLLLSYNS